jgi:NitT/TauT family transport system substrate-binding protein
MNRSKTVQTVRTVVTLVVALVVLALLRFKPWQRSEDDNPLHKGPLGNARQSLTVAYVPVTCHLTCPVTDYATRTTSTGTRFDALRFSEFPTMVEALKGKRLEAAFLTVPLAMKMREQGVPVKICCLGHRDGSEIMVRKQDSATSLRDLKGKSIAIPSPFSNENFFLHKLMQEQGVTEKDITLQVMPPPDMPNALASGGIDGFVVAEPFCSKAELDGSGRVLYYAKDIWPHYISCALVVHEDLIRDHPDIVRDLVRGIVDSGEWAETHRADAAKVVAPYFRQNLKLVNYVLTQPPTRVSYRMLNPTDAEMQRIMDMGLGLKLLKRPTPISELMDRDFIPKEIKATDIDMSKLDEVTRELPKK